MSNIYIIGNKDFLMHYGIKGQKWGERRFQNPDGTLTPEGKARYQKYVKEFGKATADRLMESQMKGRSEKRALKKEYRRRRDGAGGKRHLVRLAGMGVGSATGNLAGYGIDKLIKNSAGESMKTELIGSTVHNILAGVGGATGYYLTDETLGKKLSTVYDGYSEYEASPQGIKEFYNKIKEFQNS